MEIRAGLASYGPYLFAVGQLIAHVSILANENESSKPSKWWHEGTGTDPVAQFPYWSRNNQILIKNTSTQEMNEGKIGPHLHRLIKTAMFYIA
jgi:hypothetical protein